MRGHLTLTAKKQFPRSTSTTVAATLPVLLKALQPSAGEAMLSVNCCPKRLLMDEPKEACMTCAQNARHLSTQTFTCDGNPLVIHLRRVMGLAKPLKIKQELAQGLLMSRCTCVLGLALY